MTISFRKLGFTNVLTQAVKSWYPIVQRKSVEAARQTSTGFIGITSTKDLVGPPDPLSHIRPITFHVPEVESSLERRYRLRRQAVQMWHQKFWASHNTAFVKERKAFEQTYNRPLTSDDMSAFYKSFLDKYWVAHLKYAKQWYKANFQLLGLAAKVQMKQILSPMSK